MDDAIERGVMCEDFYFLSDEVLSSFKRMQGYDITTYFPGARARSSAAQRGVVPRQGRERRPSANIRARNHVTLSFKISTFTDAMTPYAVPFGADL